jgi:DHA2 family multidrug resistance protein
VEALTAQGMPLDQIRAVIAQLVERESMALATTHVFLISAIAFFLAATIIWLAPRPRRAADRSAAH